VRPKEGIIISTAYRSPELLIWSRVVIRDAPMTAAYQSMETLMFETGNLRWWMPDTGRAIGCLQVLFVAVAIAVTTAKIMPRKNLE